ncbi:MAG: hypothetical protein R2867_37465 [Caldilineaceae bacterium]
MKKNNSIPQAIFGIVLLAAGLMLAQRYVNSKIMETGSNNSEVTTYEENNTDQSEIPFKRAALVKTEQNGDTTETTTISRREVELTPEQEQQYYGGHPEYKGWNAAYSAGELYRYPDPWGYHTFWDMLLSDDSGETTRTVASLSIRPLSKLSDVRDNMEILDAKIGYQLKHVNPTLQLIKVAEFETVDGRRVSKLEKETDGVVKVEYVVEQPEDSEYVTRIEGNPMNADVAEANEATLDQVVRSFTYIPH